MTDDRPATTDVEAIAELTRRFNDLESTVLARVSRRPTGTPEYTLLAVAPPNTLLMQGQALMRADYPMLWQWATENGAVTTGRFGPGDGTSTFTVPDMRGRIIIGAGTLGADTYTLGQLSGAAARAMVTANLPAHAHGVAVANHAGHYHPINSGTELAGGHDNHIPAGNGYVLSNGSGALAYVPGDQRQSFAAHYHFIDTDTATVNLSAHAVTESSVGSGTAFDVRQPSLALNVLVWT